MKRFLYITAIFIGLALMASPQRGLDGAKGICLGSGSVPTVSDYVQDGLLAMWDGIDNAGVGVHDDNAQYWVELVSGGANFPKPTLAEWKSNCLYTPDSQNQYVSLNPANYGSFVQSVDTKGYAAIVEARQNLTMTVEFVFSVERFGADFQDANPYWEIAPLGFLRYTEYNYSFWGIRKDGRLVLNPASDWSHARSAVMGPAIDPFGQTHYLSFRLAGIDETTGVFNGDIFYYGKNVVNYRPKTSSSTYAYFRHDGTSENYTFRLNTTGGYIFTNIGSIYCIRIYTRPLSDAEIAYNSLIDRLRFSLGQ